MTKMKLCPVKLSGIQRITVAVNLKGKRNKQKGERDTGKVGRIYQTMMTERQTVEVVDIESLRKIYEADFIKHYSLAYFTEYLTENGYQIIRKVEE